MTGQGKTPDDPSPIYASPMDVATYRFLGLDSPAPQAVNGHGRYDGLAAASGEFDTGYAPCKEAFPDETVPYGRVQSIKAWRSEIYYPQTERDIRCYATAGMSPNQEDVALMIFNDGITGIGSHLNHLA